MRLARNNVPKRLLVPLAIVPVVFAAALALAVKPNDRDLLGFLAVLATIWMGASLSVLSIAGEREVFDHERLLFLYPGPYVLAKAGALALVSAVQVAAFVAALWGLRLSFYNNYGVYALLQQPLRVSGALLLVGWGAVGVGLVLSALAGRNKGTATFLLPLVVMMQIVFSVQVAGSGSDVTFQKAYGEFQVFHRCTGKVRLKREPADAAAEQSCPLRPVRWRFEDEEAGGNGADGWLWLCDLHRTDPDWVVNLTAEEIRRENSGLPSRSAAAISHLTLSRYGDIMLRTFAYDLHQSEDDARTYGYSQWRRWSVGTLAGMTAGFLAATIGILHVQGAQRPGVTPAAIATLRHRSSEPPTG